MKTISHVCFFVLICFIYSLNSVCYAQTADSKSTDIMLQGFHWESHKMAWWNLMASKAADIAAGGFSMVWFPPSSGAASAEGYLPHRLYLQNSRYGTEAELKNAIGSLHRHNVKAIADIVINHRVGTKDWADFNDPDWGSDSVCKNDEWPGAKGNWDTGDGYSAARDIDHAQPYVQKSIQEWMNWLKGNIGYDGWRYDYSKGYHGQYVALYNNATFPYFSVGEYWDDLNLNDSNPHRQRICNWLDNAKSKSAAFDFTTKGILQHAVGNSEYWRLRDSEGKPSGVIGWWPAKSVTFLDNHDTGPSGNGGQNHWPFPGDKVMQGYAYILTHPGIPCVYWVHYYDWNLKEEINDLIKVRKNYNLHSESKVEIKVADSSKYVAVIDGKVAVKIGYSDWNPGNGWILATAGKNYAVWVK
ncbi:MAG: alpha-amylase [Candidatus Brocadiae bacterium]|nr:alpha-amylase [Candidatus Brocadiia bacterium]